MEQFSESLSCHLTCDNDLFVLKVNWRLKGAVACVYCLQCIIRRSLKILFKGSVKETNAYIAFFI
jgi:hypothetical protein